MEGGEGEGGGDALVDVRGEEEEAGPEALGEGFEAGQARADEADVFFDEAVFWGGAGVGLVGCWLSWGGLGRVGGVCCRGRGWWGQGRERDGKR